MYTIGKTILLGIVLVSLVFVFYKVFKKLKIKINKQMYVALSVWVLFAAFVRVFEDAGIYPTSFFTVSPGIIILFSIIFLPTLFICIKLQKKIELWKSLSLAGLIGILVHLPFFNLKNVEGFILVVAVFTVVLLVMILINKFVNADFFSFSALSSHMFDASATFVSLQFFGYSEKHVLPTYLINYTGPWVMFVLKLIVLIPVIFLINKYSETEEFRRFLLLAVYIIGLAPALRDLLRLAMFV